MVAFRVVGGDLVEANPSGPLPAASHPAQAGDPSNRFRDVDGDGESDIAHLRAGVYQYWTERRDGGQYPGSFGPVSDAAMLVARDFDHDGAISLAESQKTEGTVVRAQTRCSSTVANRSVR